MLMSRHNNYNWKCTHNYAEICQFISEQVYYQYFCGCKSIYMEGVALDNFDKFKPSTLPMAQLNSHSSDENYHDDSTTERYLHILICLLFSKGLKIHFWKPCRIT